MPYTTHVHTHLIVKQQLHHRIGTILGGVSIVKHTLPMSNKETPILVSAQNTNTTIIITSCTSYDESNQHPRTFVHTPLSAAHDARRARAGEYK